MELTTWLLYTAAALGLSLTPGPNGLLALTHGALYGVRRTTATIAGGALGFTVIIALSLFGIGALLAASADILTVLKWLGGAYLVWLGIQVWRSPPLGMEHGAENRVITGVALFARDSLPQLQTPRESCFLWRFCRSSSPQSFRSLANLS